MGDGRKTRSDKKVDVKPTISIKFKEQLYRFAELSKEPVKDVCERVCVKACESELVIDEIRKWFRRNYYYSNHIIYGDEELPSLKVLANGKSERITIKFQRADYDKLCNVAYALDITPSSTVALLLSVSFKNVEFMDIYTRYAVSHLSKKNVDEINALLREIQGYE